MVWLSLIIPFVFTFWIVVVMGKKLQWWHLVIPLVTSFLLIILCERLTEYAQTSDTEYWTGYIEKAEHYEHWNETVPCTHIKYKTVTRTRINGKKTEIYTEQVADGYQHLYDVEEHPEHWVAQDNNNESFSLTRIEFERLTHKFDNKEFVDMHRNYHTTNGNKYLTTWKGEDYNLEACSHTHRYENRIMASHSILKFRDIDKQEKEMYSVLDYPEVKGYQCPMILGYDDPTATQKLEVLNARLGKTKQIRVWFVVFKNQPLEAGYAQEAYWQGGNKNELVLLIGIDDNSEVLWGHTASWTTVESVKIQCRDLIYKQKKLNLSILVDEIKPIIEKYWERRHFKEFKYLSIDPPPWTIWLCFCLTLATNSVIMGIVVYQGKS